MPAEIAESEGASLYLSLHGYSLPNRGFLHFNDSIADQIGEQRQEFRHALDRLDEFDTHGKMQPSGSKSMSRVRAVMRAEAGLGTNQRCARDFTIEKEREYFVVQVILPRGGVFIHVYGDFLRWAGLQHLSSVLEGAGIARLLKNF